MRQNLGISKTDRPAEVRKLSNTELGQNKASPVTTKRMWEPPAPRGPLFLPTPTVTPPQMLQGLLPPASVSICFRHICESVQSLFESADTNYLLHPLGQQSRSSPPSLQQVLSITCHKTLYFSNVLYRSHRTPALPLVLLYVWA